SLVVKDGQDLPFEVTARGPRGEIMALQYRDRPWAGVQFHPESVLTPEGMQLLANFPQRLVQKTKRKWPFLIFWKNWPKAIILRVKWPPRLLPTSWTAG
ncbi:MAG: hypothetical protein J5846_07945, partial [Desulfovibrio sp.]|nr:hypothetical protein [Desulfovibrio sp.]